MKVDLENSQKVDDRELDHIPEAFNLQKEFFRTGITHERKFRVEQLKKLQNMVKENQDKIVKAIYQDMGRPYFEAYAAEVGVVLTEIKYALKNLKKWMKPEKIRPGMVHFKATAKMEYVPKGVSLIVSAWNYPIHLCLMPLISSIAAGNTALIKPSELATHSAILLDELVEKYFDPQYLDVIPGGIPTAQKLLDQNFDQILFTGSEKVGRIYAKRAAETLTPIILELGGKSPTIIHKSANMEIAAERIIFGKFLNASQTCVAPDYVLVDEEIRDDFTKLLRKKITEFYGKDPKDSDDFARIINEGHFERIKELLKEVEDKVIVGGELDEEERYISPTLIDNPDQNKRIMREEIFGPLLPLIPFSTKNEIINTIRENPNPLAMYIFSEDRDFIDEIRRKISAGDVAINDVALHFAVPGLKVGGTRGSGMGGYRGKTGFEAFSHKQTVYEKTTWFNLPVARPPFTSFKEKLMKFFMS